MPNKGSDPNGNAKKLHIGNDYVTVVYNDSGEEYKIGVMKVSSCKCLIYLSDPLSMVLILKNLLLFAGDLNLILDFSFVNYWTYWFISFVKLKQVMICCCFCLGIFFHMLKLEID